MKRVGFLAIAVILLGGADEAQQGDAKNDSKLLQGNWTMSSLAINGEELPGDQISSGKLVVEDNRYKVSFGDMMISSTFTLDPGKTPKQIDFTYADGPQKGQTLKGIYEITEDTFRMCRALEPEGERPTKFDSPADSGRVLVLWKKTKAAGGK
jgi:uncharacterized protein (TIGR03067 family)